MTRQRLAIVAVVLAMVGVMAASASWSVGAAHRAMVRQVETSERMAADDRTAILADDLASLGRDLTVRPIDDRHDGEILAAARPTGRTIRQLSPDFLSPLPALDATTSLVTTDGVVVVSNGAVTAPRVKSPEVLRLVGTGRAGAATYHSPLLDTDRIGVVTPLPGTDLMVVIGADASFANRPATALAHRLVGAFAVTMAVVGALAALLLLLVGRSRDRLRVERDDAEALARTDVLTGLANRRAFEEAVAELAIGDRRISVVAIDLDGLKRVNDTLGHEAGDEALRLAAAAMRSSIRPGDLLARTGGDEFTVLLAGGTADAAATVAARMGTAVAGVHLDSHGRLAISTGVATGTGARIADALWEADLAMYRAKRARKERAADAVQCTPT